MPTAAPGCRALRQRRGRVAPSSAGPPMAKARRRLWVRAPPPPPPALAAPAATAARALSSCMRGACCAAPLPAAAKAVAAAALSRMGGCCCCCCCCCWDIIHTDGGSPPALPPATRAEADAASSCILLGVGRVRGRRLPAEAGEPSDRRAPLPLAPLAPSRDDRTPAKGSAVVGVACEESADWRGGLGGRVDVVRRVFWRVDRSNANAPTR